MSDLFGTGASATITLVVVIALVALLLARPTGRRMVADAVAAVGRWPGLVRAELRGSAPLHSDEIGDTTPDIPAVTHGLPVVERPRHRA